MEANTMTGSPRHFGAGPPTVGRVAVITHRSRLVGAVCDGERVTVDPRAVRAYGMPEAYTLEEFYALCSCGIGWWDDLRPGLLDTTGFERVLS
jgi:hypothetical protein